MYKKISLIICIILLLVSCGKKEQTPLTDQKLSRQKEPVKKIEEKYTMDKIVLNALFKLGINNEHVKKITKDDGIFYYIPLNTNNDIEFADAVLQGFIEKSQISLMEVIKSDHKKIIKSYWDSVHSQMFVIELFYSVVKPGFKYDDPFTDIGQLCIIIDDFGSFDGPLLDAFCELDPAVTFAVIPGLPFSKIAVEKAIKSGHEVIIHMPMEPDNPNINPGNNAIYHNLPTKEIYERVKEYFKEIAVAMGANQHMGSKITQDKSLMRASLKYLAENDYFFIDSKTTPNSVAREIANELQIAFEERDLFLDAPENSDEVLFERLKQLQKLKEKKNRALVITHCFDRGRLQRLNRFIEEARAMGFEIVPASKYVIKSPSI